MYTQRVRCVAWVISTIENICCCPLTYGFSSLFVLSFLSRMDGVHMVWKLMLYWMLMIISIFRGAQPCFWGSDVRSLRFDAARWTTHSRRFILHWWNRMFSLKYIQAMNLRVGTPNYDVAMWVYDQVKLLSSAYWSWVAQSSTGRPTESMRIKLKE